MRISQTIRVLLLVLMLGSTFSVLAFQQGQSIEFSVKEFSRANKKLQKQLSKLEKQYKKQWKNVYPDLSKEQLDSLIKEGVHQNQLSIRNFICYQIMGDFYLQGNYEFSKVENQNTNNLLEGKWLQNLLIGVGKRVQLTKGVKANMTVLYDFFYSSQKSPNNQPLVFRIGFGFSKNN